MGNIKKPQAIANTRMDMSMSTGSANVQMLPLSCVMPSTSVWLSKPQQQPAAGTGNSWRQDTWKINRSVNQIRFMSS